MKKSKKIALLNINLQNKLNIKEIKKQKNISIVNNYLKI